MPKRPSKLPECLALLREQPDLTVGKLATLAGCSLPTASRARAQFKAASIPVALPDGVTPGEPMPSDPEAEPTLFRRNGFVATITDNTIRLEGPNLDEPLEWRSPRPKHSAASMIERLTRDAQKEKQPMRQTHDRRRTDPPADSPLDQTA